MESRSEFFSVYLDYFAPYGLYIALFSHLGTIKECINKHILCFMLHVCMN